MHDYSMLDLFRQEVGTQVTNLKQSLSILKRQPSLYSELEAANRSLHRIVGSAQIVDIEDAAKLATEMKASLSVALERSLSLTEAQIDQILSAADLLIEISHASSADLKDWLSKHTLDLESAITAISALAEGTQPAPVSIDIPVKPPDAPITSPATTDSSAVTPTPPVTTDSRAVIPTPPQRATTKTSPELTPTPPLSATTNSNAVTPTPPLSATTDSSAVTPTPTPYTSRAVTSTPTPLADTSMLELFRLEVEAQVTILTNGLLALETQPESAHELEALMRAAHSIKGAARIVGMDAAVGLAHVMEDCFVAAQNQTLILGADSIDVLLRGVDLLQSFSQIRSTDLADWLAKNNSQIESVRQAVAAIQSTKTPEIELTPTSPFVPVAHNSTVVVQAEPVKVAVTPPTEEAVDSVEPPVAAASHQVGSDRVVRVSAENLNRMMGLAGESLIEANWLPPFAEELMLLKSRQVDLAESLEKLQQDTLLNTELHEDDRALLDTARRQEQECRDLLGTRLIQLEEFIRRTANLSDRLYREVITSHMRPFEDGVQGFARMVRDIARQLNKQVKLDIIGKSTPVDRDILTKLEAPLTHILRNAVDHGLELPEDRITAGKPAFGTVRLEAFHRGGMLAITVTDDGKGIDPELLRQRVSEKKLAPREVAAKMTHVELMEFIFLPGFSMAKQVTELSGRGVGLDIVKSMAHEVGGTVRATSAPGKGLSFHFQLPLTLSVVRTLLVEISGEAYAFPLSRIDKIVNLSKSELSMAENRQYFTQDNKNIGLIPAHQVLDLPPSSPADTLWVVLLSDSSTTYGLVVDRCLGERELVVRPLDHRLGKVQDISAAALMGDGSVVLIVDVSDLVRSMNNLLDAGRLAKVGNNKAATVNTTKRVLVVDDSITVREMERKLLQNRGYSVDVAVDGMEAWNTIRASPYDLVISDIDMPRMNGIQLLEQIKRHPRLKSIPVIVVSYRDREEDRIQGLEAGADYYLTKSSFHDDTLIQAVVDLIGKPI